MSPSDSSDPSFFLASSFFSAGANSVTATVTGAPPGAGPLPPTPELTFVI